VAMIAFLLQLEWWGLTERFLFVVVRQ